MKDFKIPVPELPTADSQKPLGAYRCGGRCDASGFAEHDGNVPTVPCSKCRVYYVAKGEGYDVITSPERRLVRAGTALEAIKIYTKSFPGGDRYAAYRYNLRQGHHSPTQTWSRNGGEWKRVLRGRTREQARRLVEVRMATLLRIATDSWKVPSAEVARIVKERLKLYVVERGLPGN